MPTVPYSVSLPIGHHVGSWIVIGSPFRIDPKDRQTAHVLCRCDCGVERAVSCHKLRLAHGGSRSCGCASKTKHGDYKTHLYRRWVDMKQRCNNPKCACYRNYGGRGIKVCPEWASYDAFKQWALSADYSPDLELDRRDNSKGYSPENCRWIPRQKNLQNTRTNQNLTAFGETKCLAEWVRDSRCVATYACLTHRLNTGVPGEVALTAEMKRGHRDWLGTVEK